MADQKGYFRFFNKGENLLLPEFSGKGYCNGSKLIQSQKRSTKFHTVIVQQSHNAAFGNVPFLLQAGCEGVCHFQKFFKGIGLFFGTDQSSMIRILPGGFCQRTVECGRFVFKYGIGDSVKRNRFHI